MSSPAAWTAWAIWNHPWISLGAALALLALAFLAVRALWRAVGRTLGSLFRPPARGAPPGS